MDTVTRACGISGAARAPRGALAVVSGVALALAFPSLAWWPLAWVALVPWYVVLLTPGHPPREGAPRGYPGVRSGFLLGLALFLVGMVWMNEIGSVPWILLSLIQAVPFALLGALCAALLPRLPAGLRPWVFAALWVLIEGLRSWGRYAFPWFLLASTQVRALPLLQVVSVTGQWGLSFAIAAVNAFIAEAWMRRQVPRRAARMAAAAIAVPILLGLGGAMTMRPAAGGDDSRLRTVAVAQGNIQKSPRPSFDHYRADTLRTYGYLTREAAQANPSFVAWPETVVPGRLLRDPGLFAVVSALARETGTPLLIGSVDADDEDRLRNTALLLDRNGLLRGRYDKTQLVPVGEFFPLRSVLEPVYTRYNNNVAPPEFASGTGSGVLAINGPAGRALNVGVIICYESAFPRFAAGRARRGAEALVLLTSDQTFGTTAGPYQHADLAVLRAAETRRWLVRAATTGVSEIIDPWGRVRESLGVNVRDVLVGDVRLRGDLTPYVRWGDWFLGFCALLVAGAAALAARARPSPGASGPGGTPGR